MVKLFMWRTSVIIKTYKHEFFINGTASINKDVVYSIYTATFVYTITHEQMKTRFIIRYILVIELWSILKIGKGLEFIYTLVEVGLSEL